MKIKPSPSGLTIIGGNNNQGKTSVLDSIAWALGGDRYRPSAATRDGSNIPPRLHIVMSNGLVVERKGKNSDLKVTDPAGNKGGQQLLNEFVSQLALDLPRFMQASDKEKGDTLLQIIGVGDKLMELERQESDTYNHRRAIGQIADQKMKFAKEMTYYPDAPKEPVSISELLSQQQAILAQNGENQRKRQQAAQLEAERDRVGKELGLLEERYKALCSDCETATRSAQDLQDQSTAELERNIADIEAINVKVRANLDKEKAEMDANDYSQRCLHRFWDVRKAMKMPFSQSVDIWNLRGHSIPMDKLAPKLIRRAMRKNYIAIIIDPIYKVITGDENSADQMANFCNQFDKVCTELGTAVIYCHHHSKGAQGGKRSMDRASGSGVFARDPDALLDLIELDLTEELLKQEENKPFFYEAPELKAARQKLTAHLSRHRPKEPYRGGVRLVVKWCFPRGGTGMGSTASQSLTRTISRSSSRTA